MYINKAFNRLFRIRATDLNGKIYDVFYPDYIKLPTSFKLALGFDQSTSQTGLAVKTTTGKYVIQLDFINLGLPDQNIYQFMLEETLTKMLADCDIELAVLEEPWGGGKYSYGTLIALKKFLEGLKWKIPALSTTKFAQILPQSWRSEFLKGPEYKGRFKKDQVKKAAVDECIKRYPFLQTYYAVCDKEMDSFDALGILEGYYAKNIGESGLRKISTTMKTDINFEKTHYIEDVTKANWLEEVVTKHKDICQKRGVELMEYNLELTMMDNIAKATSNTNKVVLCPLPLSKEYILLNWRKGKVIKETNMYVILMYRNNPKESLKNQ